MHEPQDKPSQPSDSPPPLPPKKAGSDSPPPLGKPTARVPAVGASQSPAPYQDPFAVDEEPGTAELDKALKKLPPPLPSAQTPPSKPEEKPDLPVQSGKTMRITLPGQDAEAEGSAENTSNPGKQPVAPQPPLQKKTNEPALLPGAYTQKMVPPPEVPKADPARRLPKEQAEKVAQEELSKIEGWLTGQGKPTEQPKRPASSQSPESEAAPSTPPALPPKAKSEASPASGGPPPLPAKQTPTGSEPAAAAKPEIKPPPKPPELPVKREGPPRLSTVKPVEGTPPAPKDRPPVDMPKMQMLDKKPQPLLSRQRRDKQREEEARKRQERLMARKPVADKPSEETKPPGKGPEITAKPETVESAAPPPLPPKRQPAASEPEKDSVEEKAPDLPPTLPKAKTEAPTEGKPAAEATVGRQPEVPVKPEPVAKKAQTPEDKEPGELPKGEEIVKPRSAKPGALPAGQEVVKKTPAKGEIPSAKPVKADEPKVALPAVVPVAISEAATKGEPAKPSKTTDEPAVAKPQKAEANDPVIAKPVKADAEPTQTDDSLSAQPTKLVSDKPEETSGGGLKDLSFPKVDHTNKRPAPLLSRQRRERKDAEANVPGTATAGTATLAASQASATPGTGARGSRERASKSPAPRQLAAASDSPPDGPSKPAAAPLSPGQRIAYRVGAYAALIVAVLALAYLTYYFMRETRVVGEVLTKPGSGFKIQEVAVVRDFRGDLMALAQDLSEERQPLLREIKELERNLALANEDMVGKEARLQYLREDILKNQKEIENVLKEARIQAEQIWEGPGKILDEQYQSKLEETKDRIQRRADQLKLNYKPSDEFDSPEVWVNAFRLALYDAPTGVNAGQERLWAESVLREWKEYNDEWRKELAELKTQVQEIQTKPRDQITDIRRNIADLKARIARTEEEIRPLQSEIGGNQARLQEKRELEASLEEPKYKQVLQAANPQMILKAMTLDPETGRFEWNNIQADPRFEPGKYLLWVRATREGEEYWAFANFEILQDTTVQLIIDQTRLQSVRQALRNSSPAKRSGQ